MNKTILAIVLTVLICALIGFGLYSFVNKSKTPSEGLEGTATTTPETELPQAEVDTTKTVLGKSVDGHDITAYHFGNGTDELLFIGGIHGGYSGNTALVAYELMDYLEENADAIPSNVKVTVIPVFNPDGLEHAVGSSTMRFVASDISNDQEVRVESRFNGNNVDLNRNFDCDWNEAATWQQQSVEAGEKAFSEPESQALRDYVESHAIKGAVVWYSAAGGVFASSCHNGVSEETNTLTNLYADASGYRAFQEFDFYEITGDMVNWMALKNIPAISVLLTDHETTEWSKNQKGIEAILKHYAR